MRCALVIVVLIGTSCHRDAQPDKDRCELAFERLIRIGATRFAETPPDQLAECRDDRVPKGPILHCALDYPTDVDARRCIDKFMDRGSAE